jgi:hypothetical protein
MDIFAQGATQKLVEEEKNRKLCFLENKEKKINQSLFVKEVA